MTPTPIEELDDDIAPVTPERPRTEASHVVERYAADLSDAVERLPHADVAAAIQAVERALHAGRSIFVAGNGGSAATAQHMAADIAAAWLAGGGRGIVMALADNTARWSALVNDEGADRGFASQLEMLGRPGDVLVLLSVSADSPNLVAAATVAAERGLDLIALVGRRGRIAQVAQVVVEVGAGDYGLTEDLHLWVNHCLVRYLRHGEPQVCAAVGAPAPVLAGTEL
ncbi:hypothetical protein Cch01nite_13290 [Cellulomonas chitinilytica]|uniref:SIS domain-containing protein n=1 Tax=Cellulomonas chitinilytica TaxID=398759 RepID=A0A919P0V6_9CELL|nr:SIS domain-containing protein [Cellulomonas chitinilytica]GIG20605.1 hypothetical protein Cch01nite_13290 [Cellulomonas chitinilytica]